MTVNYASEVLSVTFDDAADDTLELSITSTGYATQGSTTISGTGTVRQVVVTDTGTAKSSQFTLRQADQTLTGGISIDANIAAAAIEVPVVTGGGNVIVQAPTVLSAITLDTGSGDQTYSGPVTLAGDVTLSAAGGGDISFSGGVTTQAGSTAGLTINASSQGAVTFEKVAATVAGSVVVTARNIEINKASLVSTSGDISLVGDALTATPVAGAFHGVWVNGSGVEVATRAENLLAGASGSIFVSGRGGDAVTVGPPTARVYGVYVQAGAAISAAGAGSVTVRGTGGISTASSSSTGVLVSNSVASNGVSEIRSAGGDIFVEGTAGGASSSNSNAGVQVNRFGRIAAGGSGRVTVIGTGTATGGSGSSGVVVANGGDPLATPTAAITSTDGGISVTGTAADGAAGVVLLNEGSIASGGANAVTIFADSLTLGTESEIGAGTITAGAEGSSTLQIVPHTAGTPIDLGGDDVRTGPTRTLGLSVAEIGRLHATDLFVGDQALAGPVIVSQPLAPTSVKALTILTDAGLTLAADIATTAGQYYVADITLARDVRLASETRTLDLTEIGGYATTGLARGVAASADGGIVYVADATAGLVILDVSDPAAPTLLGSVDTLGAAQDVALSADGTTAYVTTGVSGLRVVDVSDPRNPTLGGSVPTGTAADVAVVPGGQYVAVTSSSGGLFLVSVVDPDNPAVAGSYSDALGGSAGVAVSADGLRAYICDFNEGLVVLDISDPATPLPTGTLGLGQAGVAADVALSPFGNLAYVTDTRGQLWVVDVSDVFDLTAVSTLSPPGAGGYLGLEVSADGETVFIATFETGGVGANGLVAVSVSDPTAPAILDTLALAAPPFTLALGPGGAVAYIADGSGGLRVVDCFTETPSNGRVTFTGTVDGPVSGAGGLTVATTNTIDFQAALGGTRALASLATTGTTSLAADVTVAGPTAFGSDVVLAGDVTLTARSTAPDPVTSEVLPASVTFASAIRGAHALTINDGDTAPSVGLGEVRFGGAAGSVATPLTSLTITVPQASVDSAGMTLHAGTIGLEGLELLLGPIAAGAGGVTLKAGSFAAIAGDVTSGGGFTTTGPARTTFMLTALGDLSLTAAGATFGGPVTVGGFDNPTLSITSGNQPISFNGSLNACGSTSVALDAGGGGDILFGGPVQGLTGLTVTNARNVTAQTAITGVGSIVQSAGTGSTTLADIATTGGQSYTAALVRLGGGTYDTGGGGFGITGATTLTADVTITAGAGAIAFNGTLDGGHALVLESTSTTTLGGIVGGGTALASLTTNAGGTTRASAAITTTGTQTYADELVLTDDTVLTGSTIALQRGASDMGQAHGLTITGNAVVGGNVTATGGPLGISGTTTLADSTAVRLDAGNRNVTFGGAVDGRSVLEITATGTTTFLGTVGGALPLVSLQVVGDGGTIDSQRVTIHSGEVAFTSAEQRIGPLVVDGGGVNLAASVSALVNGAITSLGPLATGSGRTTFALPSGGTLALSAARMTFGGPVTLDVATTLSASDGGDIVLGTVNGPHSLVVETTGATVIGGAIGATAPLASLTTDAGGSIRLSADVTTIGAQVFGESTIALAADVVLGGATGSFTGFTGNDRNLTLNFGGVTTLDGTRLTGLRNLTTGGGGITRLSGSLTTSGAQTYAEAVELAGPVTLDTAAANAGVSLTGGAAGIYAARGSGGSLVVRAGTGAIDLGGTAGFGTGSGAGSLVGDVTLAGGAIRLLSADNTLAGTLAVAAGSIGGNATLGGLSLDPAGVRLVHMTGTAPVTGYDQFVITADGSVTLDGATLTATAATTVDVGTVLTLVDNRGSAPVAGRFVGLPEGAFVTAGQNVFTISYVGGDGNDVTLTATAADATVSVVDDVVTIALGPDGTTITNFSTRFNRRAGTLLITLTGIGLIEGGGPGVTIPTGTETVRVNLAELPGFAGIAVRGGTGTERITVGRQGIDLASVTRGAPGQSLRIDTGAGHDDAVITTSLLSAKGAGGLTLKTAGIGEGGGVRLGGQLRSLEGSLMIDGATTLVAETKLTAGGGVTFTDSLDGNRRLTISTGGAVTFADSVGSAVPLAGVTLARATSASVQAGFALDGTRAGRRANGLTIGRRVNAVVFAAFGTTPETARTIRGFGGSGVLLQGGSTGSVLTGLSLVGNTVGISVAAGDYADTVFRGNVLEASRQVGIDLRSARGLLVGGADAPAGNRITDGMASGASSIGIRAAGSLTGTRLEGNAIRGNAGSGVVLAAAREISVGGAAAGAGNAIDGNRGFGLFANGRCAGSLVEGNALDGNARGPLNVRRARGLTVVDAPVS